MTKFRYMNIICNGLWSWEQKLTAMNYENGILLVVSSEVSVNFILLFFIIYYWIQWHWFGIVALIFLYCGAYILYRLDTRLKLFCFGFQFGGWLSLKWARLSLLWSGFPCYENGFHRKWGRLSLLHVLIVKSGVCGI